MLPIGPPLPTTNATTFSRQPRASQLLRLLRPLGRGAGACRRGLSSRGAPCRFRAYTETRSARRLVLTDSVETTAIDADVPQVIAQPFQDTSVARLERTLAASAFARLPYRWQEIL